MIVQVHVMRWQPKMPQLLKYHFIANSKWSMEIVKIHMAIINYMFDRWQDEISTPNSSNRILVKRGIKCGPTKNVISKSDKHQV